VDEPISERRSPARFRFSFLIAVGLAFVGACSNDDSVPSRLVDGSTASKLSIELQGTTEPTVLTRLRIVPVNGIRTSSSAAAACLRGPARDAHPTGVIVERVGVSEETVTLKGPRGLYGCDNSLGPRENDRRWCGTSFGQLYGGHLRDPRLDIGCRTTDGTPIGLAWTEPADGSRYVVVHERGYAEVYEAAGELPMRVATNDVQIEGSRATFDISEHDATGALLRRYRLEAAVAG
jgi:hypothetical protein